MNQPLWTILIEPGAETNNILGACDSAGLFGWKFKPGTGLLAGAGSLTIAYKRVWCERNGCCCSSSKCSTTTNHFGRGENCASLRTGKIEILAFSHTPCAHKLNTFNIIGWFSCCNSGWFHCCCSWCGVRSCCSWCGGRSCWSWCGGKSCCNWCVSGRGSCWWSSCKAECPTIGNEIIVINCQKINTTSWPSCVDSLELLMLK